MDGIETLKKWLSESENLVFFGGAGCSTESGVPDFRSVDGLYNQSYKYPPEVILSHSFFEAETEEFYRFYREKMLPLEASPNPAHEALARLEEAGKLRAVVTQNIDGLHQAAGSRNVLELHGSVHRNYCRRCGNFFDAQYVKKAEGIPKCDICGGTIKPDVVLYEEPLAEDVMMAAVEAIRRADTLIVGGTSLAVYPAAGLIRYYQGHRLILINKDETPYDAHADLVIHGAIGKVLGEAVE